MSRVYFARGETAEADGVFMPMVVIDGVGDFPADQLDGIIKDLVQLQQQIRDAAVSWTAKK